MRYGGRGLSTSVSMEWPGHGTSGGWGQLGQSRTLSDLLSGLCEDVYYLVDIIDGSAQTVGGVIR